MLDQRQLMSFDLKSNLMFLRTIYLMIYFHSSFTKKKTEKPRDTW